MNNGAFPILMTFIGYAGVIFVIAAIASRSTKELKDYVLAGRGLSGPVAGLGAGASDMSSWLLMALPGAVYVTGLNMIWMPIALSIGQYCNWRIVAKRLRVFTEVANDAVTIPAFFSHRVADSGRSTRMVSSVIVIIFFTIYAAAGFYSGGLLLQLTFGLDYQIAMYISAAVIVCYTALGGFLAVNRVDFFQGCLMFSALLVVPCVTLVQLNGFDNITTQLAATHRNLLDPFHNMTLLGMLSLAAWGAGYIGQPHILVRFMAIRHVNELSVARRLCMGWMILSLIGAIFTGLFGITYFDEAPLTNPETVFIALSKALFNPWLVGVLISAVLSAIMSTVSAMILMSSSVLTEDFYRELIRRNASELEYIWVNRLILIALAVVAIFLANDPHATILKLVAIAWSGLGASFGPAILFSLFWRGLTKAGLIAGILTGGSTVLIWQWIDRTFPYFFSPEILPGYELIPGFALSAVAIVIVSKMNPHNPQARAVYQQNIARL